MLTTFAQSNYGSFVALLLVAGVMAALSAGVEDNVTLQWWGEQARATRRFFVIAGLLGLASLAQGIDETLAWMLGVGVAFGVDVWFEMRHLTTRRR